ncbi:MAG TPA: ankyrin repeat domain-containing protein [Thermoanaerobaculia bacterium]|nr:ankyrin repeat domain-containing protein [Thermoanaerobaculia bacterium]
MASTIPLTRADFLRYTSIAAGLTAVALTQGGSAEAAASKPDHPDDLLDSQRFRRAVEQGDLALVTSYLERDPALASSRDERGRSVFVLASLAGHAEIAEALRSHLGSLDLVESVLAGDAKRVAELIEQHPRLVNEIHPSGGTAVHMAVRRGRTDLLFAMLRPGPDFNLPSASPESLTPLRLAVDHPDLALADELVDAMVGNGGNPNAPQGDGVTPLQAALAAGRTEIVRLLAFNGAEGADPKLPRNHRTSRFSYTADGSRFERPEQPAYGWPVINEYVAVAHGNFARMKELLDLYPKLLHANASWDELAVEAGAHVGFKDGVRFLLDQGAPAALPTAAMMGMTAHVKKLLAEDPGRIWECGAHNMPPIWFPAIGGGEADHLEIARLLLDAGADPNAHKRGQTALHWAARGGQMEMAELLLSRGARVDVQAKTPQGDATPLAVALKAEKRDMAELLRRSGARG